jgi:AraC family transcriptional regulator
MNIRLQGRLAERATDRQEESSAVIDLSDFSQNCAGRMVLPKGSCQELFEPVGFSVLTAPDPRVDASLPGDELESPIDGLSISHLTQTTPFGFVLQPSDDYILIARISNRCEARYDLGKGPRTSEVRHGHFLVRPANEWSTWWFSRPDQMMILRIPEKSLRNAWDSDTNGIWLGLVAMETFRQDSLISELIGRMCVELTRTSGVNRSYIRSLLVQLSTDLVRRYSEPVKASLKYAGMPPGRLRKVVAYISEQLESNLGLARLSAVAGVSRYYFCREFKKSMGVTPQHYVMQQRIERAKVLLGSCELSITEIGEQLRFPTPSHFAATFRKIVGVTPTSFRMLHCNRTRDLCHDSLS